MTSQLQFLRSDRPSAQARSCAHACPALVPGRACMDLLLPGRRHAGGGPHLLQELQVVSPGADKHGEQVSVERGGLGADAASPRSTRTALRSLKHRAHAGMLARMDAGAA